MVEKLSEAFHTFLWHFFQVLNHFFLHIVLLKCPHAQIAFFKIYQLWQSGFSRVYSNCCCSCWFEPEIIKVVQSTHKMYSNNIVNSKPILNACTKKSGNLLKAPRIYVYVSIWKFKSSNHIKLEVLIWLVGWVLWHIYLCKLFNAKSIFIQITSSVSNNSV